MAVVLVTATLTRCCHWQYYWALPPSPGDVSDTGHCYPRQVMSVVLVTATHTRCCHWQVCHVLSLAVVPVTATLSSLASVFLTQSSFLLPYLNLAYVSCPAVPAPPHPTSSCLGGWVQLGVACVGPCSLPSAQPCSPTKQLALSLSIY